MDESRLLLFCTHHQFKSHFNDKLEPVLIILIWTLPHHAVYLFQIWWTESHSLQNVGLKESDCQELQKHNQVESTWLENLKQ